MRMYKRLVKHYCNVLFESNITLDQYQILSREKHNLMNVYGGTIKILKRGPDDCVTFEPLLEEVGEILLWNDHGLLAKKCRTRLVRGSGFRNYQIMESLNWASDMVHDNDHTHFPITLCNKGLIVPCTMKSDLSALDHFVLNRRVAYTFVRLKNIV